MSVQELEGQMKEKDHDIDIRVLPTPNPNAMKFIFPGDVAKNGKSTYKTPEQCEHNHLASQLFRIRGVDQVHLFENAVTITKFGYEQWDEMEPLLLEAMAREFVNHDPNYSDPDPESKRRGELSKELLAIEEILDRTIRPGLQGDGGDVSCISYEDHILLVRYEGACGTCPSSTMGTLQAITGILRDEFDPEIVVYTVPAE